MGIAVVASSGCPDDPGDLIGFNRSTADRVTHTRADRRLGGNCIGRNPARATAAGDAVLACIDLYRPVVGCVFPRFRSSAVVGALGRFHGNAGDRLGRPAWYSSAIDGLRCRCYVSLSYGIARNRRANPIEQLLLSMTRESTIGTE